LTLTSIEEHGKVSKETFLFNGAQARIPFGRSYPDRIRIVAAFRENELINRRSCFGLAVDWALARSIRRWGSFASYNSGTATAPFCSVIPPEDILSDS
jgi:hypothetical protein